MPKTNLLLTPGPTMVPPEVLRMMAEPLYHHRTPKYRKVFESVSEDLKLVFRTKEPVFTFAGSGTLAMEAAITNFCSPGDEVIIVTAGKFGERWSALAKQFQLKVVTLQAPYGEVVTPDLVGDALKTHPKAKAVYGTLCETSTGALFDVQEIAARVAKTEAIFIVDAISGLVCDRLEMDAWNVDVVVCGSQKGFMLPPGLAFLGVSQKAWKFYSTARCLRFYTDLGKYEKSLKNWDTPFTPAITIVIGLREVLNRIQKDSMEAIWGRTEKLATKTRDATGKLKLDLFAKRPANTATAVCLPEDVDGEKLVSVMRDEKGVTFAGGQGEMKGKIVRIAHFGYISEKDIDQGMSVLRETLTQIEKTKVS